MLPSKVLQVSYNKSLLMWDVSKVSLTSVSLSKEGVVHPRVISPVYIFFWP